MNIDIDIGMYIYVTCFNQTEAFMNRSRASSGSASDFGPTAFIEVAVGHEVLGP